MFDFSFQQLWLNAIAVLPIALMVAAVCRWVPCRPTTRHALWIVVLAMFFVPSLIGGINLPGFGTDAPSSASDTNSQPPLAMNESRVIEREKLAESPESPESPLNVFPNHIEPEAATLWGGLFDFDQFAKRDSAVEPVPIIPPGSRASNTILSETDMIEDQDHAAILDSNGVSTESQWMAALLDARDAIAGIPPLPATIWLGGMGIVAYLILFRIGRVSRLVRTAERAPIDVAQTVHRAAEELGLERAPRAVMVDARISPMLWCAAQPTLILPKSLWDQLDEHGRRAVVFHELAHLKRRDHWIRWVEMAISIVYWWNPLVWWLRKRIRDEADYCCDAWVTHLMPQSRRAYAQALLESRKYLSATALVGPAVGLGAGGTRTRTFARRLTMVMTHQLAPRLSMRGLALTVTLGTAACLVTPITACPPDKGENPITTTQPTRLMVAVEQPTLLYANDANAAETTFEQHERSNLAFFPERSDDNRDDLDARMKRLEQRLDRLAGMLERMMPALQQQRAPSRGEVARTPRGDAVPSRGGVARIPRGDAPGEDRGTLYRPIPRTDAPGLPGLPGGEGHGGHGRGPVPPPPPHATGGSGHGPAAAPSRATPHGPAGMHGGPAGPASRPSPPMAPRPPLGTRVEIDNTGRLHLRVAEDHATDAAIPNDAMIVRRYFLPEGKLDALNDLMIRADVPILVDPEDDYIEVQGTAAEHRIFRAFCDMIHPEGVTVKQDGGR